jgi:hypothetical protein
MINLEAFSSAYLGAYKLFPGDMLAKKAVVVVHLE